jgi:hypothetical protein
MRVALEKLNNPLLRAVVAAQEIFSGRVGCGLSIGQKIALLENRLDRFSRPAANDFQALIFIVTTPADELAVLSVSQIKVAARDKFGSSWHPHHLQTFMDAIVAFYLLNFLPTRIRLSEFRVEMGRTS